MELEESAVFVELVRLSERQRIIEMYPGYQIYWGALVIECWYW